MKVLIYGSDETWALEKSYERAFTALGHEIKILSPRKLALTQAPFGKWGLKLYQYAGSQVTDRKINRIIIEQAIAYNPDIMLVFTNAQMSPGALGQFRLLRPACKVGLIWPDAILNLTDHVWRNHFQYDFVASYSSASLAFFRQMGFREQWFLPFAVDDQLYGMEPRTDNFERKVAFIGGWRPEREQMMMALFKALGPDAVTIRGVGWKENSSHKELKASIQTTQLQGREYGAFLNGTEVNINIIDNFNYPAANMRFFEIPAAGGLQLCSSCPEWEQVFSHRKIFSYFQNQDSLVAEVQFLLSNKQQAMEMRQEAYRQIRAGHTYMHRAQYLLDKIATLS